MSTLARLFLTSRGAEAEQAAAALAPLRLPDLVASELLEMDAERARSPMRIEPYDGLLVGCDHLPDGAVPRDIVGGVNPFARLLADLAIRRPGGGTLDLGTGCGIQALLAARHSDEAVGVDVNPRALAFCAFNARFNRMKGVECLEGSWFEPVAGRKFDLVVANPPFIVSPDSTFLYRDGGLEGDELCRTLVREAPGYLNEGGFALIQCDWIVRAGDDPDAAPLEWTHGTGCDAILLDQGTEEGLAYAARWNSGNRDTSLDEVEEAVERWVGYYRSLGLESIGSGTLVLRRRAGANNWQRTHRLVNWPSGPAGDHILRLFEAQDQLAHLDAGGLLGQAFRPVDGYRLDQRLRYRDGKYHQPPAKVGLEPALILEAEVDPDLLDLVFELDGRRPLREVVAEMARQAGGDVAALEERSAGTVRELFARGFLVLGEP